MAAAAKKLMKLTFGSPAIRAIRFTVGQGTSIETGVPQLLILIHAVLMAPQVGKEETESFAKNQEILERQGKPHCKKIERNLGTALWTLGVQGMVYSMQ
jgi:hypothetical protein